MFILKPFTLASDLMYVCLPWLLFYLYLEIFKQNSNFERQFKVYLKKTTVRGGHVILRVYVSKSINLHRAYVSNNSRIKQFFPTTSKA